MCSRSTLWRVALALVVLAGPAVSQSSHKLRAIEINGHTGETIVYHIDGKTFIELESLVRIGHGFISFRNDQIVLTLPPASDNTNHEPSETMKNNANMSSEFMRAAVQEVGIIKDWTNVMAYAVQRGTPGDGARLQVFRDRAAEGLRLAKVSVNSDSDHSAHILLAHLFDAVSGWTDKLVRERSSMDTGKYSMTENALGKDESYRKISTCATFLGNMLPGGHFQDDGSCR
jgi:hypothetical protein